jgi:hypothetical protein
VDAFLKVEAEFRRLGEALRDQRLVHV